MRHMIVSRGCRSRTQYWVMLVCVAIFAFGCQAKEPPLSPAAATFKKEIKNCLAKLTAPLLAPVAKKNVAAISAILEKTEPQAIKLCRMCPFRIGVLNPLGETLAVHPPSQKASNFSSYDLVIKTINTKKIQQQRFFLQNGSELYIICVPLVREDKVIGLIAVAISAEEALKRWGLTEKEFLAIDFNT